MAFEVQSYTKKLYQETYEDINPILPGLSTEGKVVLITGATGGIGQNIALSFAVSNPKAIILLGRNEEILKQIKQRVEAKQQRGVVQTYSADIVNAEKVRPIFNKVVAEFGRIDIMVHSAGILAPLCSLLEADPDTFMDGYKTTIVGTLVVAQALVLANKKAVSPECTLINMTTAGILYPPFPRMGAYVSSKMAAVKLLETFARENESVRLHHVHPGFIDTAMSRYLKEKMNFPMPFDEVSLPSDFIVWIASDEAKFLNGKIAFAAWDVNGLKERKEEILKERGELCVSFGGFPKYKGKEVEVIPKRNA